MISSHLVSKLSRRAGLPQQESDDHVVLPASLTDLSATYNIIEARSASAPRWDFAWHSPNEETREKKLLEHPNTIRSDSSWDVAENTSASDGDFLAEAALKVRHLDNSTVA